MVCRTSVWRELRAIRPYDERERVFRDRMVALLEHTPAPFSPEQYDPGHITASAFVLSPEDDALLLIHHVRLARWLQPGGHVDTRDSDLLETAQRECWEEAGCTDLSLMRQGIFDIDVHTIPESARHPQHEHFDVRFLFRSPTRTIQPGSDAEDAKWVPLSALPTYASNSSVMRAVQKLG